MKTIRFIAFFVVLILPHLVDARPIKFGFFYTNDALKEFDGQSGIEIRVHDAVWKTAREFDIPIVITFIEPLPFSPPLITPSDKDITLSHKKEGGIELNHFLSMLDAQLKNIQTADYIFTVTSTILWHQYVTEKNEIKFKQLDGIAQGPKNPGKHAILKDFKNQKREYFAELLWHEWGHLLDLEHQDEQTCRTIHFVMCNRTPLANLLIIEKSFRETIRAAAQTFEKQRD